MWGAPAFVELIVLATAIVWLVRLIMKLAKSASLGDQQAAAAERDRRKRNEIDDLIYADIAYRQQQEQWREKAELEQFMGGEL